VQLSLIKKDSTPSHYQLRHLKVLTTESTRSQSILDVTQTTNERNRSSLARAINFRSNSRKRIPCKNKLKTTSSCAHCTSSFISTLVALRARLLKLAKREERETAYHDAHWNRETTSLSTQTVYSTSNNNNTQHLFRAIVVAINW